MDITKAFTYVFEDKNWMTKILIGGLLSIASILIVPMFILGGYSVAIIRNVMKGVEKPLPEWEDWGGFLNDGFSVFVAQFVYTLPMLILLCIAFVATGSMAGLSEMSEMSEDALFAAILSTFGFVFCIIFLYAIVMLFISPAIRVQYVKHNELAATFRFREVITIIQENIMDILLISGVLFGLGIAFSMVTGVLGIIPCLGFIISMLLSMAFGPYMSMVSGHLIGQLARKISKTDMSATE